MEENKENIRESLKKIQGLMYYDKSLTATENKEAIEEQWTPSAAGIARKAGREAQRQVGNNTIKSIVPYINKVHRNMKHLDKIYSELEGKTYQGQPAIDGLRSKYKQVYGEDLSMPGISTPGVEGGVGGVGQDTAQVAQYQPCQGGVNKVGCKSGSIGQVQQMLGGLKVDNMFGPKTQQKLAQVAPEFSQQFTDADVPAIQAKLKPPVVDPTKLAPTGKIDTTKMGNPAINPIVGDTIPRQSNEQGATNMAVGFVNESTLSNKEQWRKNRQDRLNKKLGRV